MKKRFKEYRIDGFPLKIAFRHKSVHIPNSGELKEYLGTETESRTAQFVAMIKSDYFHFHNEALDISDDSMAVELWAHLFVQKFRPILSTLADFALTEWFAEKLIRSAETIDLGESTVDHNRKYWDWLSQQKELMLKYLV
jgi:hypothetical protein